VLEAALRPFAKVDRAPGSGHPTAASLASPATGSPVPVASVGTPTAASGLGLRERQNQNHALKTGGGGDAPEGEEGEPEPFWARLERCTYFSPRGVAGGAEGIAAVDRGEVGGLDAAAEAVWKVAAARSGMDLPLP
jgi:hypothetical protein